MTASIETLGNIINQFGVASCGDGLAVLRLLGLEVNASMVDVIGGDAVALRITLDKLKERLDLGLGDRLSEAGRFDTSQVDFVDETGAYWTPEEFADLSVDVASGGYRMPAGQPAVLIQMLIEAPDGSTESGTIILDRATFLAATGDWETSTNAEGQSVWTQTVEDDAGTHRTVYTLEQNLTRASRTQVDDLLARVDGDTQALVDEAGEIVAKVGITLQEWMVDFRNDERWIRQAMDAEDRRVARLMDSFRQEVRAQFGRLQGHVFNWNGVAASIATTTTASSGMAPAALPPRAFSPLFEHTVAHLLRPNAR